MCQQTGNSSPGTLDRSVNPTKTPSEPCGRLAIGLSCLIAMVAALGCASTKVTDRQPLVSGPLPRPATIWVYDFAATPADIPAESALAGKFPEGAMAQTPEHIATGRELGAELALELIEQIRGMGMTAEHALPETATQVNDIVLRGYLISFDEGSEKKRVGIGLGAGASDLKAAVEGFQVTAQGRRKLGSGSTDAGGGKSPGMVVGAATLVATHNPLGLIVSTGVKIHEEKTGSSKVEGRAKQTAKEIAEVLKKRFQQEGWIQ